MEPFKAIVDQYYPILYKIGRSFTRNQVDFDDLYQEMLIQIHASLQSFRSEAKLSTWLYRVALNTALTYNRNQKKSRHEVQTEDMGLLNEPDNDRHSSYEYRERIELLYASINELKKEDRAIILLHLEGKKSAEIAEILGISATNARVKFMRIKKQLQAILTRKGYERV